MQQLTAFQYICIDIANQADHDKWLWDERVEWVMDHFDILETLDVPKKTFPLYMKAVQALRAAQRGEPIGHLVGLDACCSGAQIMSALTGCYAGCVATNLINTGSRRDAYTDVTTEASGILGEGMVIARSDIKNAQMTHLYGSKAEPRNLFGADTAELASFYAANQIVFPGANELLIDLLESWNPYALSHTNILPDNYHAVVKVMEKVETRIEVDELDHATFSYEYYVNAGKKRDVKNAANVIHSIDAYVLRSMRRRCSYDPMATKQALERLLCEQQLRADGLVTEGIVEKITQPHHIYMERFDATNMVDAVIIPHLNAETVNDLSDEHIARLIRLIGQMLKHESFPLVTVHDEFKCHPNYCNYMRGHYIEIFAELAESTILEDTFMQLVGSVPFYANKHPGLGDLIRQAEYPLS